MTENRFSRHAGAIALVAAQVLIAGCFLVSPPASAQQAGPPPAVTVAPVTSALVGEKRTFTGRVSAVEKIEIEPRVSGFVESRPFVEGGVVAKGDTLFTIESGAYEATVMEIQGQIKSAEAEKTLADIEYTRQSTLLKQGNVAEAVVQRAEAERGKIEGTLLQLQGSLQRAELDLSYTKIVAPTDGRIGLASVDVGDFVTLGDPPLAILTSVDPINVLFPIDEATLLDARARYPEETAKNVIVELTLANGQEYDSKGSLDFIDVEVQQGTDTITLRASFANPEGRLIDGQLVNVTVRGEADEPSLTISPQALQKDQAGYFVLVVGDDGVVEKRQVEMDRVAGAVAVIKSGLKEGEMVITEGLNKARPGEKVDAAQADGKTAADPAGAPAAKE
ncbi:efflux RND transporter periplasmic adaptor subunit [Pikeienuella piscinae]|uniref:Efflux RND transporter periplasmic adaptor subunit n=1 Tax=Pikeienuella piscinae TaxID=2748098 RepID=A0A7L5BYF9_9RHOB|nr:efflux RND transporter periplasmic adaptor subunit [Pikeienuella piscinae]QIE56163.1 efflux RND transporter periplasmic adaptor subunit [Pikeienuella piscinae]